FFSSRRRHTRCLSDWSSDVCSSDLGSVTPSAPTSTGPSTVSALPVSALSGKALTVLGPVDVGALGVTLPHEHLLIDFEVMFREPDRKSVVQRKRVGQGRVRPV